MLLLLGYSYPAVAQFSFTLFINELLLCLAETLPICCCSIAVVVGVVAIVVIYYTLSICRFTMLIALRLNAFTFCLRGPVLKYVRPISTPATARNVARTKALSVFSFGHGQARGVDGEGVWVCGVCLN